jgi:hypothetical protein
MAAPGPAVAHHGATFTFWPRSFVLLTAISGES